MMNKHETVQLGDGTKAELDFSPSLIDALARQGYSVSDADDPKKLLEIICKLAVERGQQG